MNEIKTIFNENKIDWNSPIIFVLKNDVVLLTPQTIIEKVFQINRKQKKVLISNINVIKNDAKKLYLFLNHLGKCILKIKI